MWNRLFRPAQEAERSLLSNSSPSYNTMSTLSESKTNSEEMSDDVLVNIVSSLIKIKCNKRAYMAVNIALDEMQKRLEADEVINPVELDKKIKSFSTVNNILIKDITWYGLALFGKLDISIRIDQMIAELETRKVSTHTLVVSPNTYQQR